MECSLLFLCLGKSPEWRFRQGQTVVGLGQAPLA